MQQSQQPQKPQQPPFKNILPNGNQAPKPAPEAKKPAPQAKLSSQKKGVLTGLGVALVIIVIYILSPHGIKAPVIDDMSMATTTEATTTTSVTATLTSVRRPAALSVTPGEKVGEWTVASVSADKMMATLTGEVIVSGQYQMAADGGYCFTLSPASAAAFAILGGNHTHFCFSNTDIVQNRLFVLGSTQGSATILLNSYTAKSNGADTAVFERLISKQ